MYGTIALAKPKPGREADVVAHFDGWWVDRGPQVKGAISGEVRKNESNPAELIAVITFESKEAYRANASDPAQDAWYRKLVDMLEKEPHWIDGEVLSRYPR